MNRLVLWTSISFQFFFLRINLFLPNFLIADDYKQLVDKRENARVDFCEKITDISVVSFFVVSFVNSET